MNGCIKLFRKEIETEKKLTDAEFRLYLLFRRLADWDPRHKDKFGTVCIPIRELRANYLPEKSWSTGKVSETINSLVAKGFLAKLPGYRLRVDKFWFYQGRVQLVEQAFRLIEDGVQITEQNFHSVENLTREANIRRIEKMKQDAGFPKKLFDNLNSLPP